MSKPERATNKGKATSQDAFMAHLEYARRTVSEWPAWKQNVLTHTRPAQVSCTLQGKSEHKTK